MNGDVELSKQILQEVESKISLGWYELLTKTSYSHPMSSSSFMAYWATRDGRHLSLWNPSDVIVTLFN